MDLESRLQKLIGLGKAIEHLGLTDEDVARATALNPWFTKSHMDRMLDAIRKYYLDESALRDFISQYDLKHDNEGKNLGLVLAGNVPLVGFHDVLCGYLLGYRMKVKLSEKDSVLLPSLCQLVDEDFNIEFVDKLTDYDRVIATGSNNTSKYFEYYFKDVPHLIRKNRTSVAILSGEESEVELQNLADDILAYFGLGCRNVSTIFVPEGYTLDHIFEATDAFADYAHHNKYKNNLDYSNALYLLNKEKFFMNHVLIARKSPDLYSRISCVHYQTYNNLDEVSAVLTEHENSIQCVCTNIDEVIHSRKVKLGEAQSPSLNDFADGIDTVNFLLS